MRPRHSWCVGATLRRVPGAVMAACLTIGVAGCGADASCTEEGGIVHRNKEQHEQCCGQADLIGVWDPVTDTDVSTPGLPDGCVDHGNVDGWMCAICGNGTCGPGENTCNCPEDCG